jgi:formylglycine-generating enzyme required for sulfatase activity
VTYWSPGTPLVLERRAAATTTPRRGWRTYRVVRAVLIVVGALAAMAAILAAYYYYAHERIRLELGDLYTIASDVRVELQRLQPATNSRETLSSIVAGKSPVLRITAPATNLLVRVSARYQDGQTRVINFHLRHSSGWRPAPKRVVLRVPSAADVRAHPRMAYVPGGAWLRGDEQQPTVHPRPFWIDLFPVTVETYLPLAHRFHEDGTIQASVLLDDLARKEAVENVGLTNVPQLTEQLREIFDVIDASERPAVSDKPYVDIAAQLKRVSIACATCPAPMTIEEARAYCRSRRMRLPTADEWQLAARGADGRRFPWGDRWDDGLGNAGLPQQVGQPKRPEPSTQFTRGASPFGVIDLVGNEGDWIERGPEDRAVFLGGVYRFNGDDCTVFAETPDIGELLPRYEVTCRCVTP